MKPYVTKWDWNIKRAIKLVKENAGKWLDKDDASYVICILYELKEQMERAKAREKKQKELRKTG